MFFNERGFPYSRVAGIWQVFYIHYQFLSLRVINPLLNNNISFMYLTSVAVAKLVNGYNIWSRFI